LSKTKAKTTSHIQADKTIPLDKNELLNKYFWLVIPIFAAVYFIMSKYSVGFYQDDEIAQYLNMVQFWSDPGVILGNNPKPGYKIFLVLPALISYDAVLLVNALIASITVYMTYLLIKAYDINYAFFGAILLGLQPLIFDLSFRSYSEIFTALCLVSVLMLYLRKNFVLSALLMGYVFTIRQELALLIVVFFILFIKDKKFIAAVCLAVFPILYNILGFIKTGDIMFVLTEMQKVAGLNYKSQGLMHYFAVYIYIVGPVSLTLFLLGFFGFFQNKNNYSSYIKKYLLLYITFISIFVVQMLTMINDGPNPGNWRYLLHISPICAVFATLGMNNLAAESFKKMGLIIAGIFAFIVLIFLSKATDGFVLTDESNYSNLLITAALIALAFMFSDKSKIKYLNNLSLSYLVLALISLLLIFQPKKLSAENVSVKEVSEFINTIPDAKSKKILSNHSILQFYSSQLKFNPNSFSSINKKSLGELPSGSIIVWENHYGYRPEWGSDVNIETFQNNPQYVLLKQFPASDRRFIAYVFEKK
jgi:hypothetical protein